MTQPSTMAFRGAFRVHSLVSARVSDQASEQVSEQVLALLRQVGAFLVVGALGFVVDLSITLMLTQVIGVSALLAKPAGVGVAFLVTFAMNRRFTFGAMVRARDATPLRDMGKYFVSCATAQSLNYLVYCCVLLLAPRLGLPAQGAFMIVGASVLGAGVAANVTFFMARHYAFAQPSIQANGQAAPAMR